MSRKCLLYAVLPPFWAGIAMAAGPPVAVSPGEPDMPVPIETSCPTLSWSGVPEASAYELLVYTLGSDRPSIDPGHTSEVSPEPSSPALRQLVPGGALSFTPSGRKCLERGRRYAWAVRVHGDEGPGEWSDLKFFEVDATVSAQEVERALETIRQYLAERASAASAWRRGTGQIGHAPGAVPDSPTAPPALPVSAAAPLPADETGILAEMLGTTLRTYALHGITHSNRIGSAGVVGEATATDGPAGGVYGKANSPKGTGVRGVNEATSGLGVAAGVAGVTWSNQGAGVYGYAQPGMGTAIGVQGESDRDFGTGVRGAGFSGVSGTGRSVGVSGQGPTGVSGSSSERAVYGEGTGPTAIGVYGFSIGSSGYAGFFHNESGDQLAAGPEGLLGSLVFRVDNDGDVFGKSFRGDGSQLTGIEPAAHTHAGVDIDTGSIADARIAASIARDGEVLGIVLGGDGSSSTLDADLLDGSDSSSFAQASHTHSGGDVTSGIVADGRVASTITRDAEVMPIVTGNDGPGSDVNADLLDGQHAAFFAASGHQHLGQLWSGSTAKGLQVSTTSGIGLLGIGSTAGIYGQSSSATGTGGWFVNVAPGGNLIAADNTGIGSDYKFRVDYDGDVYADRSFNCGLSSGCFNAGAGADVAERIEAAEALEPGDVVEIDLTRPGRFRRSSMPYSRTVAGVISTAPAITLNNNDLADNETGLRTDDRPLLTLVGQVPVKASSENGAIRPGDLLVASSLPGYAMRCEGVERCFGRVLGKALEPLDEGAGVINMLAMPR